MEKIPCEVDLEDWEILSDDGFLDLKHEDGKGFFSKGGAFFDVNYFRPSPPPPPRLPSSHRRQLPDDSTGSRSRNRIVPVPIRLESSPGTNPDGESVKDTGEVPTVEISIVPPAVLDRKIENLNAGVADQDPILQVFFKKMKENEFVDMKMDSPRSSNNSFRGLKPQIEVGQIQFEGREKASDGEDLEPKPSNTVIEEEKGRNCMDSEIEENGCWEGGGLNIWRWKITGIGALCSLGVAAATFCIFILGGNQRHNNKQRDQNQKLRFQIYTDDKRFKQVVHHATRLNQALSAVRGVPTTRAHITFGGYYDGL